MTAHFPLLGLHCAGCAGRASEVLRALEGITSAHVNLAASAVSITYDESRISPEAMQTAIREAGYQLIIDIDEDDYTSLEALRLSSYRTQRHEAFLALGLSLPIMVLSMVWMHEAWAQWLAGALTAVVLLVSGRGFYQRAYRQITQGGLGMDTLVALSTGVAFAYSVARLAIYAIRGEATVPHLHFEAATMIIAFVLLGKLLEARAKSSTTEALRRLTSLQPQEVTKIGINGQPTPCPIGAVMIGDRIVVAPGERIAVDGTIISGETSVDGQMLTGEAIPISKRPEEQVLAGMVNLEGSIIMEATAIGRDTILSGIVRRVRDAQGSRAPIERLVDKVASIFVPTIVVLALLTMGLWLTIGGTHLWTEGLTASIAVLVIACPCALGLATPTAIMVGVGKGAEHGLLIKDAESLEMASHIDVIVLDKTGTVTSGKPQLKAIKWFAPLSPNVLGTLIEMERSSQHPLAGAIVEGLSSQDTTIPHPPLLTTALPGRGVIATLPDNSTAAVGNMRLIHERGIALTKEVTEYLESIHQAGMTSVLYADQTSVLAVLGISDKVKSTSASIIGHLRQEGIEVWMLTGDHEASARAIAREIDLDEAHIRSGVLPEDKANFVAALRHEGKRVAMVGDGINDSAALAEASLSIAMGTGSDIAMHTAMATITSGDLGGLVTLTELSRATMRTIRRNLFWAFAYNVLAIPLAAGILYPLTGYLMPPMVASLAMALSSISVVMSSLRLKSWKIN